MLLLGGGGIGSFGIESVKFIMRINSLGIACTRFRFMGTDSLGVVSVCEILTEIG